MIYQDTLFFDDTDLSLIDGIAIGDLSGLYAPGNRRGQHDVIPGRPGLLGAELPYDAYTFSIPITVLGEDRIEMHDILYTVADALAGVNGLGQLKRRLTRGSTFEECTANGQFAAYNSFTLLNPANGRTELTFVNLDGFWRRTSDNAVIVP